MLQALVVDGSSFWDPKSPDLDALFAAADRLAPSAPICVDAASRHRLPGQQRSAFAKAVNTRRIVCPPAGTIGGTNEFLRRVSHMDGVTVVCTADRAAVLGGHTMVAAA